MEFPTGPTLEVLGRGSGLRIAAMIIVFIVAFFVGLELVPAVHLPYPVLHHGSYTYDR